MSKLHDANNINNSTNCKNIDRRVRFELTNMQFDIKNIKKEIINNNNISRNNRVIMNNNNKKINTLIFLTSFISTINISMYFGFFKK